ncbi:RNA 2',3'-cyclic phosphodiesterase [Alcaligenaceae bacterium CGII-47]|nr:RNA 2',3'-cyclic phosphodiesterase [Alcaligenaceae bacterium CGII-47]
MSDLRNHPNKPQVYSSGATRRLFIGLWPDPSTVDILSSWALQAQALCGGRIMRADTLHLTLAFLGSVTAPQVAALREAVPTWRMQTGPLELSRFGRFKGPRIVWAGPSEQRIGWLDTLYGELWERLTVMGFTPPEAGFRPHVSLLRNAGPGDLSRLIVTQPHVWVPRRCVLVASTPAATGSYYEELGCVLPA